MATIALIDRDPAFEQKLRTALRPHALARCAGWPEVGGAALVVWNLDVRPAESRDLAARAAEGPGLMVVWDGEAPGPMVAAALRAGAVDARSKLGGIEPLAAAAEAYLRRQLTPAGSADDGRLLAHVQELLAGLADCTDFEALRAQVLPPLLGLTGADAGWLCAPALDGSDVLPPGQLIAAERLRREFGHEPTLRWHLRGDGYLARCTLNAGSDAEGELWIVGDVAHLDRLAGAAPLVRAITGQLGLAIAHLRHLDETRQRAERDGLTRLANHAHLRRELYAEHERVRRYGGSYALLLLDVDHLEAVNEARGRTSGDAVLQAVAGLLDARRRSCDLAARRGGGEFALLLPQTDQSGARHIAERLMAEVRALDVRGPGGEPIGPIAATAGFAGVSENDVDPLALLARAEASLGRAKAEGQAVAAAIAAAPGSTSSVPDAIRAGHEMAVRLPAAPGAACRTSDEAAVLVAREFERLKADFLSTASHELRTPLSAILGYAELLQDNLVGPLNQEQTDFVAQIESNAQRLVALVEAMLDAARHEHAPIALVHADMDLQGLCSELIAALEPAARRARIELAFNGPTGALVTRVDARRIRQAVAALVENGVKFTPEGGRIELRLSRMGDNARIEVADDGIGIPPSVQCQLFQKFYQVDGGPTRLRNGAGLGLYVAKAIVEAHGGVIGVQSEYGLGSTFWITLPGVLAPVG